MIMNCLQIIKYKQLVKEMELPENAILLSRPSKKNASLVKNMFCENFFLKLQAHNANEGDWGAIWSLSRVSIKITNNCYQNLNFVSINLGNFKHRLSRHLYSSSSMCQFPIVNYIISAGSEQLRDAISPFNFTVKCFDFTFGRHLYGPMFSFYSPIRIAPFVRN